MNNVHKVIRPLFPSSLTTNLFPSAQHFISKSKGAGKHTVLQRNLSTIQNNHQQGYNIIPVYEGTLAKAARIMKLASIASFVGASAAVPFFFAGESEVPVPARTILAATTMGMTGSSTALAAWAIKPYVTRMHIVVAESAAGQDGGNGDGDGAVDILPDTPLLVETFTFLGSQLTRLVFPEQLAPASIPLTSWTVQQPSESLVAKADKILAHINGSRAKGNQVVHLAQNGDRFYVHAQQGIISETMRKIVAAAPCQQQQ
ncbi:hypothetical protein IWW48_001124 [Coemansia sp. RSA 1200]|nr:hypothetical protein IWW48_001124 [Coemansia sp. RSA 1200]